MAHKSINSRGLRRVATNLIDQLVEQRGLPEGEREDLTTSLVRQWITYDGRATLFLEGDQVYFHLEKTPLGRDRVACRPATASFATTLTREWRIRPEDLPEVFDQLNRGQSMEVTNEDGEPLRVWVDPGEGSYGVDALVKPTGTLPRPEKYHRIASRELEQLFAGDLPADELEELAASVTRQWLRHDGHACLFPSPEQQFVLTLTEREDGNALLEIGEAAVQLGTVLRSLGVPPELDWEVISRTNLHQDVEFEAVDGRRCRLWHDPRTRLFHVEVFDGKSDDASSLFCPHCSATLSPWTPGQQLAACPSCGHGVSRP
jgi:hypothetical protein